MPIDNTFSNKPTNILKAALPYIPSSMHHIIVNLIKFQELSFAVQTINAPEEDTLSACGINLNNQTNKDFNPRELFNAVKPFLNQYECERFDMIFNMMNVFQFYNTYKNVPGLFNAAPFQNNTVPRPTPNNQDSANKPLEPFPEFQYDFNKFKANNTEDNSKDALSAAQNNEQPINTEALKSMLNPNQRAMLDAFSSFMNNKQSGGN